jgi:tetratricopeptide (TPR) repeat protein
MNNARIQLLLGFVEEEPDEPFNVYALAMEYLADAPAQALPLLEKLLTAFPHYLPTYYQAAQLYADLGNRPKAVATYDLGIQLAQLQKSRKTLEELQRARQTCLDDDDD